MLFPTVQFAIFFPIVLALSWALNPKPGLWKPFIIAASYVFYMAANWKFAFLIGGLTVGNQIAAHLIHRAKEDRRRKQIVGVAVAMDLTVLGIFKYYSFFAENINDVLNSAGLGLPLPLATIALPIGVSFFTFQSISYIVDIYRREVEPTNVIDLAIYLSFFPHLVAGPIVRAKEFLPQLKAPRDPNKVAVGAGVLLIAVGLVKKVVIADTLAREVVDPVFAVPEAYAAPDILLAAYGYTAQIYCDFSGYTDMAIGLALLMGYVFPQNFMSPYRATGFQDFWRRWHMTLSRFLRDYIYIPLGGNRKGKWKTYRNLMITFVLGGLWHGAAWTFILWGFFHASMLIVERVWNNSRLHRPLPGWFRWALTFHLVIFGWILFRAQGLDQWGAFMSGFVDPGPLTLLTPVVAILILVAIVPQLLPERGVSSFQLRIERVQPAVLGVGLALLIVLVGATLSDTGVAPFIYFAF